MQGFPEQMNTSDCGVFVCKVLSTLIIQYNNYDIYRLPSIVKYGKLDFNIRMVFLSTEKLLTSFNFVYEQPILKLLRSWLISEILHGYNCFVDRQHSYIDIIMPQ